MGMGNVFDLVESIRLDSREYDRGLAEAGARGEGTASKIANGAKALGGVAVKAIGAASAAITAFGATSVKTGMSFDSSMSQVAATMGTTVDEIQNLRDFAQEMGSTTAFSAGQAADGLNVLAMAGFSAEQQMASLPSVLSLAAAGGLDLATAADFATGVMAGFGQEVSEVNTKHVADLLSTMSASAKGSVADFGSALSTVAGMASTTGQSMDDMAVALEILGNNNVSASEGGNALSRTLKNLYQATDAGKEGLDELGVAVYTASGEARPLQDVLLDLNKALDGMNDQAKNEALSQIFDAATLKSVPFLIDGVTQSWDSLARGIKSADGAADEMAATQLDNLAGDVTLFKSALEGVQIAVSDGLTPSLRDFVQLGTNGLSAITEGFKSGGIAGAVEGLGQFISDGLSMIFEKLPEIVKAGGTLLKSLIKGIKDNAKLIADSAVDIVMALADGIVDALPEIVSAVLMIIAFIAEKLTEPSTLSHILQAALDIITGLAWGLVDAIPELIHAVISVITGIVAFLVDPKNMARIIGAAMEIMAALAMGIIEAIPTLIMSILEIPVRIVEALFETDWAEIGWNIISGIGEGILGGLGHLWDTISGVAESIVDGFLGFFGIHSPSTLMRDKVGKNLVLGITEGMEDEEDSLEDVISDIESLTTEGLSSNMDITGGGKVEHTGTIRIEGVNNEGEFVAASEYALEEIIVDIMKKQARLG